ncbi:unnamed protein product [Vitrella brassicaformis CCMP3155]|uniref:PCI domain-containing protein n=2 Tax=Vitrella brassicaformis TaxID=1169539 RepID=A0A0G4FAJ9_VITBC|nr:unnamed protein product [Vitrella brassicaformis CCMP3155]|mmetsp:Transcript_5656/g.13482  ORF Transcript_5656/g.13482 Transcript_5656/m.13482 type:complete len:399 (+) Transcript_5656:55-1251(+)|eukprot:CEM10001.1 unnamed protein product [Vitrella brassicaformis CCMP3155]
MNVSPEYSETTMWLQACQQALINRDGKALSQCFDVAKCRFAPDDALLPHLSVPEGGESFAQCVRLLFVAMRDMQQSRLEQAVDNMLQSVMKCFEFYETTPYDRMVLPVLVRLTVSALRVAKQADLQYTSALYEYVSVYINRLREKLGRLPFPSKRAGHQLLLAQIMKSTLMTSTSASQIVRAEDQAGRLSSREGVPKGIAVQCAYFLAKSFAWQGMHTDALNHLLYAWRTCHKDHRKNLQSILMLLVPLQARQGLLPARGLLDRYGLPLLEQLVCAVRKGNIRSFDALCDELDASCLGSGTYLLINNLRRLMHKTLCQRVYMYHLGEVAKAPPNTLSAKILPIGLFTAAFKWQVEAQGEEWGDAETCSTLQSLMSDSLMRGYISYERDKVVIPSQPFP